MDILRHMEFSRLVPCVLLGSLLSGCFFSSSKEDTKPPTIVKSTPETLRAADTLTIEFSENIDTVAVKIEAVTGNFAYAFAGESKLRVWGTQETGGLGHFQFGAPVSFDLVDLRDADGNEQEPLTVELEFVPWLDGDALDSNYGGADTLRGPRHADTWATGANINRTLETEGLLLPRSHDDFQDFKVMALKPLDTLSYTLECPEGEAFEIELFGPYLVEGFDDPQSAEPNMDSIAEYNDIPDSLLLDKGECKSRSGPDTYTYEPASIDYGRHSDITGNDEPAFYVLRISVVTLSDFGFYKLTTQIARR